MNTKVERTKRFEKDLDKVPEFIRVKVIAWIRLVETLGLREARKRPGYHDETLKGLRKGQRSIRLRPGLSADLSRSAGSLRNFALGGQ